jgi:hypothetical protein
LNSGGLKYCCLGVVKRTDGVIYGLGEGAYIGKR